MSATESVRRGLIREAERRHVDFSQYHGYWDDFQVYQARKAQNWKNRKAYPMLAKGELVLGKPVTDPQILRVLGPGVHIEVFVPKHPCSDIGSNCLFDANDFERVGGTQ
jgi:hypothetical protein